MDPVNYIHMGPLTFRSLISASVNESLRVYLRASYLYIVIIKVTFQVLYKFNIVLYINIYNILFCTQFNFFFYLIFAILSISRKLAIKTEQRNCFVC